MSEFFRLEAPFRGDYVLQRLTFGSGEPVVSLVAGIHGNEVNGTYALNLLAGVLRVQRPRGTVHLLPLVNVFGAEEGRKRSPYEDRDLNDAFPGVVDGPPAERIAAAVLRATEGGVAIDVQSGSSVIHEVPHARSPLSGAGLELARAAGLSVVWKRPMDRMHGLVGAWVAAGQRALVVRGGRGGSLDPDDARAMGRARVRILAGTGSLPSQEPALPTMVTPEVRDYRSGVGGFFVPEIRPGDRAQAGQLLGVVRAAVGGEPMEEIRAEAAGIVLGVRVYPLAHARELLVRVAEPTA